MEGVVKFFNQLKNYGFIAGDDGKDYFVHISGVAEGTHLEQGDRVKFDAEKSERGEKATNVEKIEA